MGRSVRSLLTGSNDRRKTNTGLPFDTNPELYVYTYTMRRFVVATLFAFQTLTAAAQTSPAQIASGPTTRVLAIGKITEGSTRDKIMPVMQQEVRDTVRLYLAGKLDQWFTRRDQNGVVFLLNVSTVAEARALLEALPLGKANLMTFDLIPLGPLSPLGLLLAGPEAAAK